MTIVKAFVIRHDDGSADFAAKVNAFGRDIRIGGKFRWIKGRARIFLTAELPGSENPLDADPPDQVVDFVSEYIQDTEEILVDPEDDE